jgi:hypothetical protein
MSREWKYATIKEKSTLISHERLEQAKYNTNMLCIMYIIIYYYFIEQILSTKININSPVVVISTAFS